MFNHQRAVLRLFFALAFSAFCPQTWSQDYITPPMVNIPAGQFMMGTEGGDPATQPIHQVHVNAFQMSKYTVTVAEFRKFADNTGFSRDASCNDHIDNEGLRGPTFLGKGRWDNHNYSYSEFQPVVCVSWQDANAYAQWLSEKTGIQYRLPTEQEWEYAAKANTTTRYYWGDDPDMSQACHYGNFADYTGEHTNNEKYGLSNVGWIEHVNCDDGEAYNAIVGLYRPNPFGLYDMLGNTSEFVNACYDDKGYKPTTSKQETPNQCEFIVHRGSNWHYPVVPTSTRGRFKREGWNVGTGIGFRLVVDGHQPHTDTSTTNFEHQLANAQTERLNNRPKLLATPENVYMAKLTNGQYQLRWTPTKDARVTSYEVFQSKAKLSHYFAGYYQKHYDKISTVPSDQSSLTLDLLPNGGSYRVVAISDTQRSLPSTKAHAVTETNAVAIPGRFDMRHVISLKNVPLYYWEAKDNKPEAYTLFKTNKNSDKSQATARFRVNVKQSGWYQFNYRGRSFHKGEFFKLWQGNRLLGTIDFDPEIDDKSSSRHQVFLQQGSHELELSVLRDKFDRWGLSWLEFTLADNRRSQG